jgi:hypothetical protein
LDFGPSHVSFYALNEEASSSLQPCNILSSFNRPLDYIGIHIIDLASDLKDANQYFSPQASSVSQKLLQTFFFCRCVQDNRLEADEDGAALVDLLYTKIVDLRSKQSEFSV